MPNLLYIRGDTVADLVAILQGLLKYEANSNAPS